MAPILETFYEGLMFEKDKGCIPYLKWGRGGGGGLTAVRVEKSALKQQVPWEKVLSALKIVQPPIKT